MLFKVQYQGKKKLLPPTPAGGEQIAGHLPSSTTWLTFPITTPTSCGHQSSHPGSSRRLFIEEVGEMLVTPHIKKRGRLPRSSAAATMVSDLQGAAAGPSLISEQNSRRQCHFCMDRRVCNTCCKCGKFICKDHNLSICSPCST
ncbi:hypothetical protein KUCAC02_002328 [Chaenocephalus aceratus]|uniref:Uncharacterized protein n=1 Tax=Chaenocephalus aceratus TaxID=36190 RepID=A0ACB9XV78_CHAAC|nr:hypothetical protein KUCAC02_002328 [Chaenocephalus aceratus]